MQQALKRYSVSFLLDLHVRNKKINSNQVIYTVALRYTLRRFEIQTSLRRFEGTLLRFEQPSAIRGYAFAIRTAFDDSNKPSAIRAFDDSNKPSTIRAFDDSNKPSAIRTSLRRFMRMLLLRQVQSPEGDVHDIERDLFMIVIITSRWRINYVSL